VDTKLRRGVGVGGEKKNGKELHFGNGHPSEEFLCPFSLERHTFLSLI